MDMEMRCKLENLLMNLMDWTNCWAYDDQANQLLAIKDYLLEHKKEFKKIGFDIDSIFKQLDMFEQIALKQNTITNTREESLILTAMQYAKAGTPIISSRITDNLASVHSPEVKEKHWDRFRFDTIDNLMGFYVYNGKNNNECITEAKKLILSYIKLSAVLTKKYPDENHFYIFTESCVIALLKILYKNKDLEAGRIIISKYDSAKLPSSEKYEKIKSKFSIKITKK